MESNINKPALVQQDALDASRELAQCIHDAIERLPDTQRSDARQRVIDLMQQMPSPQAMDAIMVILEPGFQDIKGRA